MSIELDVLSGGEGGDPLEEKARLVSDTEFQTPLDKTSDLNKSFFLDDDTPEQKTKVTDTPEHPILDTQNSEKYPIVWLRKLNNAARSENSAELINKLYNLLLASCGRKNKADISADDFSHYANNLNIILALPLAWKQTFVSWHVLQIQIFVASDIFRDHYRAAQLHHARNTNDQTNASIIYNLLQPLYTLLIQVVNYQISNLDKPGRGINYFYWANTDLSESLHKKLPSIKKIMESANHIPADTSSTIDLLKIDLHFDPPMHLPTPTLDTSKLLRGIGQFFLGIAITTLSVLSAIASFGGTLPFSTIGIKAGLSWLLGAVATIAAAFGLAGASKGAKIATTVVGARFFTAQNAARIEEEIDSVNYANRITV